MDERKELKVKLAKEFLDNDGLFKDAGVVTDVLWAAKIIAGQVFNEEESKTVFKIYTMLRSQETIRLIMETYKDRRKSTKDIPIPNSRPDFYKN